jgi:glutamate formiminotransferase
VAGQLIECVPNFSEGRNAETVRAIEEAIASVSGVFVLRAEMDADHNRSVITFAGTPEMVREGALRGIAKAVERIDLRKHKGVHPRIGAVDVVPFVPMERATLAECVEIAHRTGQAVWEQLGVPVYFYEAAARSAERGRLENCRRGGFENPKLLPDLGGPELHTSAGACVIGARNLLIAFNVNLDTADVGIARAIARKIRASSGGLPYVKAMGVSLATRGLVQVSMNLTNFERTGLDQVYKAVSAEADRAGVAVSGIEIVGLVPRKAVEMAAARDPWWRNFDPSLILENRLAQAGER